MNESEHPAEASHAADDGSGAPPRTFPMPMLGQVQLQPVQQQPQGKLPFGDLLLAFTKQRAALHRFLLTHSSKVIRTFAFVRSVFPRCTSICCSCSTCILLLEGTRATHAAYAHVMHLQRTECCTA
jgi:hypothetical protein